MKSVTTGILLLILLAGWTPPGAEAAQPPTLPIDTLVSNLTHPDLVVRTEALAALGKLGDRSAIPALIEMLRFGEDLELEVPSVLESLSGQRLGRDWSTWMEWLAARPDVRPHPGFVAWKSRLYQRIDPHFKEFLYPGVKHRIRIEEIAWGGVKKDGIPALTNPRHVKAKEATYLTPDELVLGLSVNGDPRAYPLRIMDWHEMANDVVGGKPITISY